MSVSLSRKRDEKVNKSEYLNLSSVCPTTFANKSDILSAYTCMLNCTELFSIRALPLLFDHSTFLTPMLGDPSAIRVLKSVINPAEYLVFWSTPANVGKNTSLFSMGFCSFVVGFSSCTTLKNLISGTREDISLFFILLKGKKLMPINLDIKVDGSPSSIQTKLSYPLGRYTSLFSPLSS